RPATFVLSGVMSRRTYASLVTCSMRPPSHAFQLRVMVTAMASAISTISSGVPNRSQLVFVGLIECSTPGRGAVATGAAPISNVLPQGRCEGQARSHRLGDQKRRRLRGVPAAAVRAGTQRPV